MERVSEAILRAIEPLLPKKESIVGRPEMDPLKAFIAISYVLITGCQWSMLPKELGCSSTVHGKFMKWSRLGIMEKLMNHARCLYEKNNQDNNWLAIDTSSKKAPFANFGGKNPTDRAKRGI